MSKEKLYGLRDQLSKFLYDPTPDQAAWRDKMWEEGRFDESIKITKQVETQLEEVETQIEAFEAAEPELGEKIVANTLLNLPLGKQLKGTGLGSLLGLAEEELGAAETQRLKDIEQEIYELNAIRQRDLEGGKVTSGTISGIDAEIEKLMGEKEGLMSLISKTPTTDDALLAKIMVGVREDLEEEAAKEAERIEIAPGIKFTVEEWNDFMDEGVAEERGMSVEEYRQSVAEKKGKTPKKYKAGGLVMNYGDYGRSYT